MDQRISGKKIWKPPSFEDFNLGAPNKKFKLDIEEIAKTPETSTDVLEPKNVDELAIHPKKIEEVRNWIKRSSDERAPILLVTGPTGAGKTITVKVSAKAEGVTVKEWINPVDKTEFKNEAFIENESYDRFNFIETKQTTKFEEFIFRSGRYNSLFDMTSNIIIVEDIPNIYIWKPKLFHEFLEKYKLHGKSPIIFILTDDQNLRMQNDLFPNHIKAKHNVLNIKFNPVNNSCLMRNLKNLAEFHCLKVPPQFLESISRNCGGDLRSATNDLLLYIRTSLSLKKPKKKSKKDDIIESLTSKDSSFDFYHVLGRILYPKLMSEKERLSCSNPNQIFLHDVQKISESWSNSFLGILHENYLQTFGKFQDIIKAAETFSFCDLLGRYQELDSHSSLIGVISFMLNNKEPKKCGFNPIKKSVQIASKKFNCDVDGFEYSNLSQRDMLLDIVPLMKYIKQGNSEQPAEKVAGDDDDDDDESDGDDLEIEEFED